MKRRYDKSELESMSLSQALDNVEDTSNAVREAQATLEEFRALRDDAIRFAYDGGISVLKLIRLTNLSREAIYKITHKGRAS